MTKYRGPWNAAGVRHRQTPRVYKPCKPVGSNEDIECSVARGEIPLPKWTCCKGCGHHMCSCEQEEPCLAPQEPCTCWPALKPQLPITLDKSNEVHCYPHHEAWDRLTGTGCTRCQAEKREQAKSEVGQRLYPGALVSRDAATGSLVPFNFNVPANRVVGTTYEQLEKGDQVEVDLLSGLIRKAKSAAVQADMQPLSPAYLDGIDDQLAACEAQNEKPR
jgi:hypothetical protein